MRPAGAQFLAASLAHRSGLNITKVLADCQRAGEDAGQITAGTAGLEVKAQCLCASLANASRFTSAVSMVPARDLRRPRGGSRRCNFEPPINKQACGRRRSTQKQPVRP